MSDTKFTSGPWEVVDHEHYPSFRGVRGPSFDVKAVMVATDLTFVDYLQRDADLRLIAAAPDLYEALETASKALEAIASEMTVGERYTNAGQYLLDALEPVRAALAKARGE